jgi:hypothetical protein
MAYRARHATDCVRCEQPIAQGEQYFPTKDGAVHPQCASGGDES